MSHYLVHNQVDALAIDRIFLESHVLRATLAGAQPIYADFKTLSQDVFFALYKIYPVTDPSAASDTHQRLLDPLLQSTVLPKLRRRSAGSLPDSYVALKRLLDFFLEKTRGRDIIARTDEAAAAALSEFFLALTPRESALAESILRCQDRILNRHNLAQLLQDIYDFSHTPPAAQTPAAPAEKADETPDDQPAFFEEALQRLEDSYDDRPGEQAVSERLDQAGIDQSFQGGLETEMKDRFSAFLKHHYLTPGHELGQDTFLSQASDSEPVQDRHAASGVFEDDPIAIEAFSLTKKQAAMSAEWTRGGPHRPVTTDRALQEWSSLSDPAALPWDQVLEDITQDIDRFNHHLNELGIRKASLQDEDFDGMIDIYRRLDSPQFRQMIDRIGRNKRYARRVQYQKKSRQAKPIDRLDRSQRIDDMIDDEYLNLALDVAAFETDFYDRYLSDALLTRKMRDQSDRRRGPIIVCYDGSGSMSGMKIQDTRTHILTLLEIARIQQRHLIIIQFASKAEPLFIKELDPLEISARDVYDILDTFLSGGTDFELPLNKALDYIRADRHRKSDILFFTDGLAGLSQRFKDDFQAQKEKYHFRLFTVIMHSMTYEDYGDIGEISDEILTIEEQDLGQTHDRSYQRIYQAI